MHRQKEIGPEHLTTNPYVKRRFSDKMFEIRCEARYGEKMRDCDIQLARTILTHAEKLAYATGHMRSHNWYSYDSNNPNFRRAAQLIIRFNNLLDDADCEFDSLHECYLAQFTDFDDDGEMIDTLPDFDYSEQSRIDEKVLRHLMIAEASLIEAICDFSRAKGYYAESSRLDLHKKDFRRDFIRLLILPETLTATECDALLTVNPVVLVHSRNSSVFTTA